MKIKKEFIKSLIDDIDDQTFNNAIEDKREINVILEGGGFNGAYEVGVMLFLRELTRKYNVKIGKISGVSVGSIIAILFLLDKLDLYEKYYKDVRKKWHKNLIIDKGNKLIKKIIYNIDDETFESIKNNKLYISYFDLTKREHITKSVFEDRKALLDSVIKSIHMPLFKCQDLTYIDENNTHYIDGLYPYLFEKYEISGNSKTLYVSINKPHLFKNSFNTKNEDTCFSRIIYGILNCYDLFKYNKQSDFCSFIDKWSALDNLLIIVKHYCLQLLVWCIFFLNYVNVNVLHQCKGYKIYDLIYNIFNKFLKSILIYIYN